MLSYIFIKLGYLFFLFGLQLLNLLLKCLNLIGLLSSLSLGGTVVGCLVTFAGLGTKCGGFGGATDSLTRSQLHGLNLVVGSGVPGLEVIGRLVRNKWWVKFLLEDTGSVWEPKADVIEAVVGEVPGTASNFVLGRIKGPFRQDAETLACLTVREFAERGDRVGDGGAVLEELNAAVTSACVVHDIVFSVKVDVRDTCAFT